MLPTITLGQAKVLSLFMLRAVPSGRGCAVTEPNQPYALMKLNPM
jgi:hypothetical protein